MKILVNKLIKLRAVRFVVSGGSAAATNLVGLFILVHYFHVWYLLAAVISFIASVCVSFTMQKFFTFNDYSREKIRRQTIVYLMIQIINLGLNTLFMYISVDLFNIHYMISQAIVGGTIAAYSFFVYKHVVFVPNDFGKNAELVNSRQEKNDTVS